MAKVAAVSVGKPKFAAHDADLRTRLADLLALRDRFVALADEDAAAFAALMRAYRLPKATDDERAARATALQEGMRQAAATPLRIMAAARDVLGAAEAIATIGNPNALGDCGAAGAMAVAAMRVSLLNVTANIAGCGGWSGGRGLSRPTARSDGRRGCSRAGIAHRRSVVASPVRSRMTSTRTATSRRGGHEGARDAARQARRGGDHRGGARGCRGVCGAVRLTSQRSP